MKRVLTVWLVAMLLLANSGSLLSCGKTDTPESDTTAPVETTPVEETALTPTLPDTTYGGATYRFYHNDYGENNYDIIAESLTGEALNDIVYQRNLDTEEKFDIQLDVYLATGDTFGESAIKSIAAGDDAYDVVVTTGLRLIKMMSQNLVYDLNENMPYMDLEKPWWNASFQENMTLNGKLFAAVGDISHIILESLQFLTFNLDVFDELGIDAPYNDVRDGTWTFDKFKALVDSYTADTNGDGKIDKNDQYGYLAHDCIVTAGYLYSNGVQSCSFQVGLPSIDLELEKVSAVWEAYRDLLDTTGYMIGDGDYGSFGIQMFMENRVLFSDATMRVVRYSLRDMESDYGVVPLPKFREELPHYNVFVGCEANVFTVPVTATATEMISAVLEYMAYYGYENITEVYYDEILGQKLMRDQDSRDMLTVLRDNMYFDFCNWSGMSTVQLLGMELLAKDKNPASHLAANRTKMETELHDLLVSVNAIAADD